MPNIISGRDLWDVMPWDDEIGLPRTAIRRARREARAIRRRGTADRIVDRAEERVQRARGTAAVAEAAESVANYGAPLTLGTDLLASAQRRQPFGWGNAALTTANPNAILPQVTQKPMQPTAMVVSAIYTPSGGTPVDGTYLVTVDEIKLGTASQLAGVGPVPALYFRPDTVQSHLSFSPIGPGVTVLVRVSAA